MWFLPVGLCLPPIAFALTQLFGAENAVAFAFAGLASLPLVSVGYRRLHDVDLEGYLFPFAIVMFAVPTRLLLGPFNITENVAIGFGKILVWNCIIMLHYVAAFLIFRNLFFASDPNENDFGPNPNEVPS